MRVLRSWRPSRAADLATWRQRVGVLEYDEAVAERWGQLQARAQRRGRLRPHNDPWVDLAKRTTWCEDEIVIGKEAART